MMDIGREFSEGVTNMNESLSGQELFFNGINGDK